MSTKTKKYSDESIEILKAMNKRYTELHERARRLEECESICASLKDQAIGVDQAIDDVRELLDMSYDDYLDLVVISRHRYRESR